jgi:putative intracellular protease/amidase
MRLIENGSAQANSAANYRPADQQVLARNKKVAIFIFDGVQIIDYTGPYEVFGQAGFEVFTVAERADAITTAMGMSVNPKYTFANHPQPNILLIPGGGVRGIRINPTSFNGFRTMRNKPKWCSPFATARFSWRKRIAGWIEATTFASLIPGLQTAAPKTKVVSNKRFVDNGKIITSAGLSSGIDGSLHVIEKLLGKGWAQSVATNLEYNWDPESKYVRAALADKYLENTFSVLGGFEREILSYEGGADHWESKWKIQTDVAPAQVLEQLNNSMATADKWARQDAAKTNGATKSLWKFTGEDGKAWSGLASVETFSGEKNKLAVTVRIARSDAAARIQ